MISARRSEREEKVMQFKLELELEIEKVAIIECSERVNTTKALIRFLRQRSLYWC